MYLCHLCPSPTSQCFLPISLAAVVNVMSEMGINDISTYPSLHTHHFLKMFLDFCIGGMHLTIH